MILRPIFTDDFNRADGTVGSNYTDILGNGLPDIVSNKTGIATGANKTCRVTGTTPIKWNQRVRVDQISNPGDGNIHLWVRTTGTSGGGNLCGYHLQWNAYFQGIWLEVFTNNSSTTLISAFSSLALSNGDTLGLQAYESEISVWKNDVKQSSYVVTDTTYPRTIGSWGFGVELWYAPANYIDNLVCYDIYTGDFMTMFGM